MHSPKLNHAQGQVRILKSTISSLKIREIMSYQASEQQTQQKKWKFSLFFETFSDLEKRVILFVSFSQTTNGFHTPFLTTTNLS